MDEDGEPNYLDLDSDNDGDSDPDEHSAGSDPYNAAFGPQDVPVAWPAIALALGAAGVPLLGRPARRRA